jgi:neutral ceramidase
MKKRFVALILFSFVATLTTTPDLFAGLRVGFASVDVTPPVGVPLAGYGGDGRRAPLIQYNHPYAHYLKPSEGILDPIKAKVMVVENGKKKLVFISIDMIGASLRIRKDVLSRLPGFTENEIFISGTHSHSGPGTFEKNWIWEVIAADKYVDEIYRHIVGGILHGVQVARMVLQPAAFFEYSFNVSGLQDNRSGRPGHFDSEANVLIARGSHGQWLGGMIGFAIHGTFLPGSNLHYSADVTGAIATSFELEVAKLNEFRESKPVFLFINGAEGDVEPRIAGFKDYKEPGKSFAAQAVSYLHTAAPLSETWSVNKSEVNLGLAQAGNCTNSKFVYGLTQILNPLLWTTIPNKTDIWSISWGHLQMMTWPGEATTDLGLILKNSAKSLRQKKGWVFGLTNDHLAYFVTPSEFKTGHYEACSTFYGPNGGTKVTDSHKALLR